MSGFVYKSFSGFSLKAFQSNSVITERVLGPRFGALFSNTFNTVFSRLMHYAKGL